MSYDAYADPASEALLRAAQDRFCAEPRRRRTLITEVVAAALFILAAGAIAVLATPATHLSLVALGSVSLLYLCARRVSFPVGSAYTWPAELAFLPMLFLLPLPWVPLILAGLQVIELSSRLVRRCRAWDQALAVIAANVADNLYAIGPVLVLVLLGGHGFAWSRWPVYLLAFAAQVVGDAFFGMARTWFGDAIRPTAQKEMLWLYVTDAAFACAGLPLVLASRHTPEVILLELPLVGLLGMLAQERTRRLKGTLALSDAYRGTALLLGDVIEDDDEYTGQHSRAVLDLSLTISDALGLDSAARQRVEFGALLHDVGKIRVPKEIINKSGKLDDAEFAIIRQHTIYGQEMLTNLGGVLADVGTVVRHSHESWDGSGYPDRLRGVQIPIESRVISTCDAFNAMTTDRPYRKAMTLEAATAELRRCSGTQFDPSVVDALLRTISPAAAITALPEPTGRPVAPVTSCPRAA